MSDFRSLLVEDSDSRFSMPIGDFRLFNPIKVGKYTLSIQAHSGAYCKPAASLGIADYEEFEVAIFDENDDWVKPDNSSEVFAKGPDDEWGAWTEYWPDGSSVGGYVPVKIVQQLFRHLQEISGDAEEEVAAVENDPVKIALAAVHAMRGNDKREQSSTEIEMSAEIANLLEEIDL